MKRLILSSQEEFNPKVEDIDFVGPCCIKDLRDLSKENSERFAKKLFKNISEIKEAANYLEDYSERLIKVLSKELNKIHKTNFSTKFWSIILMPWLISLLQVFFERYLRLKKNIENEDSYEIRLIKFKNSITIKDTIDFYDLVKNPKFNHYLYSLLIISLKKESLSINIEEEIFFQDSKYSAYIHFKYFIRNLKRKLMRYIGLRLSSLNQVYIDGVNGLSIRDLSYISAHSFIKTSADSVNKESIIKQINDIERRGNKINFPNTLSDKSVRKDEFEVFVAENISLFLPTMVTKRFSRFVAETKSFFSSMPKTVNTFILGPLLGGYDPMKFITSFFTEFGGKLVISQHGSNFGYLESFPKMSAIEYSRADLFLTWGWKRHSDYQVNAFPLTSPLLGKLANNRVKQRKERVILITNTFSLFADTFSSLPQPENVADYVNSKFSFFSNINKSILSNTYYRPYSSEFFAKEEQRKLQNDFPKIKIFKGNLTNFISKSRFVVIDHPGTSMLEAFAIDVPTLLFWDKDQFGFSKEAQPYFDSLEKVGILHYSPESAADFLNKHWHEYHKWWENHEVRTSLKEFCLNFALKEESWKEDWLWFLKNLHNNFN